MIDFNKKEIKSDNDNSNKNNNDYFTLNINNNSIKSEIGKNNHINQNEENECINIISKEQEKENNDISNSKNFFDEPYIFINRKEEEPNKPNIVQSIKIQQKEIEKEKIKEENDFSLIMGCISLLLLIKFPPVGIIFFFSWMIKKHKKRMIIIIVIIILFIILFSTLTYVFYYY